ncbi:uncharacterized protein UDID_01034 [Ustilago sp. UG-2017a]|nr:uncharacterized protein UDID_01034 [Ustilago sp. UG-2017a]
MTSTSSPARSFARDEVTSPFRNAFASSSSSSTTKPVHSPFLNRRARHSNQSLCTPRSGQPEISRPPDAISTSSSTLVNADTASDYRPWEVRSEASLSTNSLDSATISRGGRATPTSSSALEDIGTLPSIHISPLPSRADSRAARASQGSSRTSVEGGARRSVDSSLTRIRPIRQLCPDDCRCSDQDIDLGLCRRVVGSSSSGSESGSLSVGMHAMRPRATADSTMEAQGDMKRDPQETSHLSSQSQSETRSQGRDFDKDPILVPKSARKGRSSTSTYQHSFDQLQRGLDTLDSNESDVDSDVNQVLAAQRRAESMARWTARRSSMEGRLLRSPAVKVESTPGQPKASPSRTALIQPRPELKVVDENTNSSSLQTTLFKATPGRKSIAAVFESMQKDRKARAAEEHKQWQEKQARRERERAARAFGLAARRRTSAGSNSILDSPASVSTVPDTPPISGDRSTREVRQGFARSPVSSAMSVSPLLSSPGSPKVDEGAAGDVQPRHLVEEATARIPDTLAKADEAGTAEEQEEKEEEAAAALPTTPKQPSTSAFGFASQPMALDLSPAHTISSFSSSPASSPRKNAHRRQDTNTVSQSSRFPAPTSSLNAARARLNQVLDTPQQQGGSEMYQMPKSGILKGIPQLSSAAKRGHSVRFSPRPDYRSDSGSWDESGQQSLRGEEQEAKGEDGRERAVERWLLPAREITIPDVLASASVPMETAAVGEEKEASQDGIDQEELAQSSPKKAKTKETSQLHTPSKVGNDSGAATSFSQSVRFPGAYVPTPTKPSYSRHVIKPSPQNPRMRILPFTSSSSTTSLQGRGEYVLLLDSTLASASGSSIPRESTPPPSFVRAPDDPRNSPRSPRPANLGREQSARFNAGSSSDDSGSSSPGVVANTKANEGTGAGVDDSLQLTIGKILKTVEESHSAKKRRSTLRERLTAVSHQLAPQPSQKRERSSPQPQLEPTEEDGERQRIEELRGEVMHALAVLADRLGQLNSTTSSAAPGDISSTSIASFTSSRDAKRGLPRWAMLLVVIAQCALIAYLLSLAEQQAQHMRMFSPSPHHALYRTPGEVNWNARAQDIHLTPLLSIPGLSHLAASFPPLPSPSFLNLLDENAGLWTVYRSYIRLHGWTALVVQLGAYAVAQLISCIVLLILAPVQVLWLVVDPTRF